MNYPIPPWLSQGADPARQYAGGFALGMRMGESQAAQQMQQQALLREQHRDEIERQYRNTKMQMDVDAVMRKQRAQAAFSDYVRGGGDPMEALMKLGPAMGESMNDLIRTRAMMENYQGQQEAREARARQQQEGQESAALRWMAQMDQRERAMEQSARATDENRRLRQESSEENRRMRQQQLIISAQRAINADPTLARLRDLLREEMNKLNPMREKKATDSMFGWSNARIEASEKAVKRIQERIREQENILLAPFGLTRETAPQVLQPAQATLPQAPGATGTFYGAPTDDEDDDWDEEEAALIGDIIQSRLR